MGLTALYCLLCYFYVLIFLANLHPNSEAHFLLAVSVSIVRLYLFLPMAFAATYALMAVCYLRAMRHMEEDLKLAIGIAEDILEVDPEELLKIPASPAFSAVSTPHSVARSEPPPNLGYVDRDFENEIPHFFLRGVATPCHAALQPPAQPPGIPDPPEEAPECIEDKVDLHRPPDTPQEV